ncbi:MAG: hypothetical protein QNI86_14675 [Halieaceae bacterium]|nr:hypothetical protein [Halieaceae bacterium]
MFRLLCTALIGLLAACASGPTYNPTVFPYEIDEERLAQNPMKRVVISHVNIDRMSRRYLQEHEARVDKMIEQYLEANGIEVIPARTFEQEWRRAVRAYGNVFDPATGEVNRKSFALALIDVRDALAESENIDGIVFTDLLEQETTYSDGLQHVARWHGVTRKPTLQGPGDGVTAGFNWAQPLAVASLWVSIYDMELKRVFTSIGGLDTTQAIDTRSSSGRYVRRRSILESDGFIEEGIALAFHPFVEMKNYPGPPATGG